MGKEIGSVGEIKRQMKSSCYSAPTTKMKGALVAQWVRPSLIPGRGNLFRFHCTVFHYQPSLVLL